MSMQGPQRLYATHADFSDRFKALLNLKRESDSDVMNATAQIIADVRQRGMAAVLDYTQRFDRLSLTETSMAIPPKTLHTAFESLPDAQCAALKQAAERIQAYHTRQRPEDAYWKDADGVEMGWRWRAVDSAGLYVPGGLASYPSSVLMNAIPARVAGVQRLVVCVPAPDGQINPLVLAALHLSQVDEVYQIGGAQAIAALAYGAGALRPVDKITGPGNAFVAAAKRQVFGKVGIDSIAGPSEVLIIADEQNNPDWLALDLMAQAEHDESAQSILITDSPVLADAVCAAVERRLETLERRDIARKSWQQNGAVIVIPHLTDSIPLANEIAAEHLQLCVADPEALSAQIRHAGAIFLGKHTPEAIGDYVGGPNHVLPTSRTARFSSGLSVLDFMKRTTLLRCDLDSLEQIGDSAQILAKAESLEAHGLSIAARREQ